MSATPSFDFNFSTPACIEWTLNNATEYLIDPDPQRDSVKLEASFSSQSSVASFQLHCPIRVKGIEFYSCITSLINIRSIVTLKFDENPEIPEIVRKKLNCKAVCLHLDLCQPLDLIAPTAATEPIQPRKRPSGQVIDALRSLATATAINIYISAREISVPRLAAFCEAVSQNRLLPIHTDTSAGLASLFNGRGGKFITLSEDYASTSRSENPPSYDQLESLPPKTGTSRLSADESPSSVATSSRRSEKKRRRLDDSSTSSEADDYHSMWILMTNMRKEMHKLTKRVERLEKENKDLNDELDELRASCEKATDVADADEAALLEVHEDIHDLRVQVDFLAQGRLNSDAEEHIIETVKESVLTHFLESAYNAKIVIEKG
ncbi:hypothetical protein MKX08_009558 [Trichoderma sp. CBMAI-0020]|nr:hypothetical protein MKX08_009558 [Trichoderma sp. CBMAI-0020]